MLGKDTVGNIPTMRFPYYRNSRIREAPIPALVIFLGGCGPITGQTCPGRFLGDYVKIGEVGDQFKLK